MGNNLHYVFLFYLQYVIIHLSYKERVGNIMQKPKISMREIAKLADVSVATVSRAVNHTGRMSDETRNRILKIMQENDYPMAPLPLDKQVEIGRAHV